MIEIKYVYLIVCLWVLSIMFVLAISGCSTIPKFDSFKAQSCLVVYCESSENNKVKKAGLVLVDIAANSQGIDLDLNSGICEQYYNNREVQGGFVYAKKSAYDICRE